MNKQIFLSLVQQPLEEHSVRPEDLEKVIHSFPYCQAAHVLLARISHRQGHLHSEQNIRKASLYTLDRHNLKNLVWGEKEIRHDLSTKAEPLVPILTPIEEEPKDFSQLTVQEDKLPLPPLPEETETKITPQVASQDPLVDELMKNLEELKRHRQKNLDEQKEEKEPIILPIHTEPILPDLTREEASQENVLVGSESQQETAKEQISLQEETLVEDLLVSEPPSSKTIFLADPIPLHPVRMEDVVMEASYAPQDDVLLDYLYFLNQQRNQYRKNRKMEAEIINKLIKEDPVMPKLDARKVQENQADLSESSTTIGKMPVSESFARILLIQGKKDKAIEVYKELCLKYPEKSAYFEAQIEKIKISR